MFIDHVTAGKSNRIYSEMFQTILSAHIQSNPSKLKRRFTVQMNNGTKHTMNATRGFQGIEVECSAMAQPIALPESD